MKTIVFILYLPLTKKIEGDFYISELIQNGFEVHYWDISNIYFNNIQLADMINRTYVETITSLRELENKIRKTNVKNTLFIPQITYEWRVYKLFRLLSKYNCKTAFFARGALPMPSTKKELSSILKYDPLSILKKMRTFILSYWAACFRKWGYIKAYDYIFLAGERGIATVGCGAYIDKAKSTIFYINSFDYENYLRVKDDPSRVVHEKYCVFLDEYLPFHPDSILFGIKTIEPTHYFDSLNKFFDKVEKFLRIKVIIAAHPKSDYKINPYNNRPLFKYQTNELVKDSEFTMAHISSSINFSVLYNRPIIFLTTNEYLNVYGNNDYKIMEKFGDTLGSQIMNCDDWDDRLLSNLICDENKYFDYKYKYLTSSKSENKQSSKIFIDTISSL